MNTKILQEIWIYPIKSLPGIPLQKATVLPKGLQYDRRWMLVDENGRFLTQREHPEMALFHVKMESHTLWIRKKPTLTMDLSNQINPDTICLNLNGEENGSALKVQIWKNEVEAYEVNQAHNIWFTKQLGLKCKLVFFPEKNKRDIDPEYAKNSEQVSLSDGYPFLIIGQSSLDLLNKKLDRSIKMIQFRPNFVFTSSLPHEEDNWKNFKVGVVAFEGVKPCARCIITTINPETGEKGVEPLKTLSTYRKQNGKINFGENIIARGEGEVKIGDQIEIMDFK